MDRKQGSEWNQLILLSQEGTFHQDSSVKVVAAKKNRLKWIDFRRY